MVVGVVADNVAFGHHTFYQFGRGFDVVADDEECGGSLVLFQRIQNCFCIAVFVTGVEGQIKNFFVGLAGVEGVKLGKIICGRVGDGRFAFFLKA